MVHSDRLLVLLQGDIAGFRATEPRHCRVAALDKGPAIARELRLALARLGGSEPGNITLKEY